MYSVVVGEVAIAISVELQPQITEILTDSVLSKSQKHEQICKALSIGRFVPAPNYKNYALRATVLNIFDGVTCCATYGGWYECYSCHQNIDTTLGLAAMGQACHNCGKKEIQNLNLESFKKQAKDDAKKLRVGQEWRASCAAFTK